MSSGQIAVSFRGAAGSNYVLERSTNLVTWTDVQTNIAPTGGFIAHANPILADAAFYRARCN